MPQGGTGYRCLIFLDKTRTRIKKTIMSKGKVKFFNTSKGFGFITQNEGEDLFFHVSELRAETTNEGDQVEYEIGEGRKGACAVNIREVRNA